MIEALNNLIRKYRRPPSTSRLYVITVSAQLSKKGSEELADMIEPIRQKYGVDFIVLEPGFSLRRFDDY
jgi:hypothetical protein